MITVGSKGFDETIAMLEKVSNETEGVMKTSVYMGAKVVADEMKTQLNSLKTSKTFNAKNKRYCFEEDKQALIQNMGVSKIKGGDSVNTKVGFDGYFKGKNGKDIAVPLVANAINAGTSFMYPQPFMNATKRSAEKECISAMQKQLDTSIKEITK